MRSIDRGSGAIIDLDGDKLKGLRTSQGLTLADVAERAGISFSFVGHIEHERCCPGLAVVERLRDVFGSALEESGAIIVTEKA